MLVVSRFAVPEAGGERFLDRARTALVALARCPGYRRGRIGRSADEPDRWVLVTEWEGVGAYRRALSSFDVRVQAAQFLGESCDEPSAYEVLVADDGERGSDRIVGGTRESDRPPG